MRVRCIKTRIKDISRIKEIGGDASHYLNVGDEFLVYSMLYYEGVLYVVVFLEESQLVQIPFELFDVIDNTISDLWVVHKCDRGGNMLVYICPELFTQVGFFDNFAEREDKERSDFEELRKVFEK